MRLLFFSLLLWMGLPWRGEAQDAATSEPETILITITKGNQTTERRLSRREAFGVASIKRVLLWAQLDERCTAQSYTLYYVRAGMDPIELRGTTGGRFPEHIRRALKAVKPGDQVVFTNIRGSCLSDRVGRFPLSVTIYYN